MISKRKMITINEELCNGCGQCVPSCEEGALAIVDGKARLVKEIYCDGLGACLGDCPTGALKVEVREADDFDPDAVARHLKAQGRTVPKHMPDPESLRLDKPGKTPGRGGCPGAALKTMTPCGQANIPTTQPAGGSALSHWPVQLRLVPPTAPFLKGADLLLTADCVPVAMPSYHGEYVPNRVVLMGCPKFDNQMEYIEKLAEIIAENNLNSITVMEMEVPCCASMSVILREAVKRAGSAVDTVRVTVARTGAVLETVPLNFEV
ncbi:MULTISPECIES: 4Fe-4S binding protein [unclassified Pseudodesulfovibrio]|uniref:ATP-binding protein n=1 Tax=unclassified Pseudodesulfovibrio TaxID=2661612 RepID=UPI000FEBAE2F|nr:MULTISPECIES: 4Fe-4S binding protein [unclassified Pseudodesulfovibrio]MCJ2163762.1 4Fe-4S binding protein [Pseudodesulfovibrio sp. S3-i]RWU05989.1 4Fe-4S ferredoxin [Pseudodesulfovibrio sp. S3]